MKSLLVRAIPLSLMNRRQRRQGDVLGCGHADMEMRDTTSAECVDSRAQALVEQLSKRELEVLRLVAEGLSNKEIAERLFLALDTIKGHNRRIFGKLDARRRTEAIARARELGLL